MFRFAATIFVSAFLLFQVQPLIGRFILPWFGGGPSIWTSCMLFFQILLLGGYLYAHVISVKLKLRTQIITHLSLLAVSLVFLPIAPGDSWKPTADQSPLLQILLLLLVTVGGPYFMLSSTGPLMQKWFSITSPGKSPYRLYALSNIGSLLALLSYPFAFEPWLTLRQQVWSWSVVYAVYAVLACWCAIRLWRSHVGVIPSHLPESFPNTSFATVAPDDAGIARPGIGLMLLWLGLAACGSAMLLATTNQLCIDVATVPFLWVLPLSLYLISFIICFDSPQWYDRKAFGVLLIACCPVACWIVDEGADVNISKQIAIYSAILFACCMSCHGELVSCKPHPKYLTLFYVLTSAGGALGGVFVAIIAPYTFHGYWEYHISLIACCAVTLAAWCVQRVWQRRPSAEYWICAVAAASQLAAIVHFVCWPLTDSLSAVNETISFGVCGLIQLLGMIAVGAFGRRRFAVLGAFAAFSLLQLGWLYGFGAWKFPAVLKPEMRTAMVWIGIASPIVTTGLVLLWGVFSQPARRISVSFVILPVLIGVIALPAFVSLCSFLPSSEWILNHLLQSVGWTKEQLKEYFGWTQEWRVVSFSFTTAAALMMEWSSRGFRGPESKSLGFWFWVPSITLVLLLANQLAETVEADNKSTQSVRTIHTSRNFYGVLRVKYESGDEEDFMPPKKSLTHGQIRHGFQFDDDYWKRQPTTYYGRKSGIGLAIAQSRQHAKDTDQHALRVGVVGLGTGTIAAYGEKGEYFRFYDINPDVLRLSDDIFTYLKDSAATWDVEIGDARIVMERELAKGESQQFDVLAIDAFSSDAIPVHLLTSECGDIYKQQLRPGGILAIHISNRFLDLNPVSRGMAEHLGWQAIRIENASNNLTGVFSSTWILLTSRTDLETDPAIEDYVDPWKDDEPILHWTDDYSGLWHVLTF